jgi:hypothetical protein
VSGGSSGEWYVLVETHDKWGENWRLRDKVHVEGGQERALSHAEELARSYARPGHGLQVFRTSEPRWLVEIAEEVWSDSSDEPFTVVNYVRLSVAELVHATEAAPAERPEPKKGMLRRALGRD